MDTLIFQLKSIRLSAMASTLPIRLQEAAANELSYVQFLQNLIDDELTIRKDRLLNRRLKQAGLPTLKTLDDFDFAFNASINKQQIKQLATTCFVANNENILLTGPPGVGKTHLAVSFAINAINNGFTVLYRSIFDLARDLAMVAEHEIMDIFVKTNLLIIDELGMKKLPQQLTEVFLEIIHRRYLKCSTIIATNRPIEDWGKILGDNATAAAVLDRFLENAHFLKITGKSFRMRNLNNQQNKSCVK